MTAGPERRGEGQYARVQRPNSWTKSLESFSFAIQIHLYRFALRVLFLQILATSYSFYSALLYTVNHTPFPMVKENYAETSSLRTLKIMPSNLKEIVSS